MFTIKLINNNSNTVSYSIWDTHSAHKINEITVNKRNNTYSLKYGNVISNDYESAAYRTILEGIKLNAFPKVYSNGWC